MIFSISAARNKELKIATYHIRCSFFFHMFFGSFFVIVVVMVVSVPLLFLVLLVLAPIIFA